MNSRDHHVNKTPEMRLKYRQYFESQDYEPTVEEKLNFNQTSQTDDEPVDFHQQAPRPSRKIDEIKEHFKDNWLTWVLVLIAGGVGYLVYDSKVAFIELSSQLKGNSTQIQELKIDESKNSDKIQNHDISIAEFNIKIDQISNSTTEIKTDLKDIQKRLMERLNSPKQ